MPGVDEQDRVAALKAVIAEGEACSSKPGPNDRLREIEEALKAKEAERAFERASEHAPFLRLVVRDTDLGRGGKRVEVWQGEDLVGQLPAASVEYEMNVQGISVLKVGVHVNDAVLEGGNFR